METFFKKKRIIRKRIILAQKQANVVQRNYRISESRIVLIYSFSDHLYLADCVSYNACVHGKTYWFLVAIFLSCSHKLSNNLAVFPVVAFRKFSTVSSYHHNCILSLVNPQHPQDNLFCWSSKVHLQLKKKKYFGKSSPEYMFSVI